MYFVKEATYFEWQAILHAKASGCKWFDIVGLGLLLRELLIFKLA